MRPSTVLRSSIIAFCACGLIAAGTPAAAATVSHRRAAPPVAHAAFVQAIAVSLMKKLGEKVGEYLLGKALDYFGISLPPSEEEEKLDALKDQLTEISGRLTQLQSSVDAVRAQLNDAAYNAQIARASEIVANVQANEAELRRIAGLRTPADRKAPRDLLLATIHSTTFDAQQRQLNEIVFNPSVVGGASIMSTLSDDLRAQTGIFWASTNTLLDVYEYYSLAQAQLLHLRMEYMNANLVEDGGSYTEQDVQDAYDAMLEVFALQEQRLPDRDTAPFFVDTRGSIAYITPNGLTSVTAGNVISSLPSSGYQLPFVTAVGWSSPGVSPASFLRANGVPLPVGFENGSCHDMWVRTSRSGVTPVTLATYSLRTGQTTNATCGVVIARSDAAAIPSQSWIDTDSDLVAGHHLIHTDVTTRYTTVAPVAGSALHRLDQTVSCPDATQFAISGSMRVVSGGDPTKVALASSVPVPDAANSWRFIVINTGPATANVDLYVVCTGSSVLSNGVGRYAHAHALTQGPLTDSDFSGATGSADCVTAGGPGSLYIPTGSGVSWGPELASVRYPIISSGPTVDAAGNPQGVWNFTTLTPLAGDDVMFPAARCLLHTTRSTGVQTPTSQGALVNHKHYLDTSLQEHTFSVPQSTAQQSFTIGCPDNAFVLQSGYTIAQAAATAGLRVVGFEPLGETGTFFLYNPTGAAKDVTVRIICLNRVTGDSTGNPTPVSTATQRMVFDEHSENVSIAPGSSAHQAVTCDDPDHIVTAGGLSGPDAGRIKVVRSGHGRHPGVWLFELENHGKRSLNVRLHVKCLSRHAGSHTLVIVPAKEVEGRHGTRSCPKGTTPIRHSGNGGLMTDVVFSCLSLTTAHRPGHHHGLRVLTRSREIRRGKPRRAVVTCPEGHEAIVLGADLAGGARLIRSVPRGRRWVFEIDGPATGHGTVSVTCLHGMTHKPS
ncbi:MAG: hypothetical protein ACJ762_18530 [Solirubrobacteraceae bacterium]